MTTISFKEFLASAITEDWHPELKAIASGTGGHVAKQTQLIKKIKELHKRGESTGLEDNMPKGSSRAFALHKDPEEIHVDGEKTHIKTGTKIAITASLDKHRDKTKYPDSLGTMQNRDENGDGYINNHHRVLTEDHEKKGHFHTNHDGIFPPLLDHDHENHQWSHIGQARDLKAGDFNRLTKCKTHPKGISHKDFCDALERRHNQNRGKHWQSGPAREEHLDHVDSHPLVEAFHDYHGNFGAPPNDWRQKKNMGVWHHPITGKEQIVGRDHGFSHEVEGAYQHCRKRQGESFKHLGNRY